MGPLPKRKFSAGRTHRRRAHDFLTPTGLAACPTCGKPKPPHIVCPSCGEYRGKAVVSVARPEAEEGEEKK